MRLSTGGRREDSIQAAEADGSRLPFCSGRFLFFFHMWRFRRVVFRRSDNWVSVERLVADGNQNTASVSSLKSYLTSIDLRWPRYDATGGAEMSEAASGCLVLIWRVDPTNELLLSCCFHDSSVYRPAGRLSDTSQHWDVLKIHSRQLSDDKCEATRALHW